MNNLRPYLHLVLIPALALIACDPDTVETGLTTLGTTGGSDTDNDDDDDDGETLSTSITASGTDGGDTDDSTDGTSSTGNPTGTTTDSTTTGTTGGDPVAATVYEIQQGTVAPGTTVEVSGVVITALRDTTHLFVQEMAGGEYSGVYVNAGDIDISGLAVGDVVDVVGVANESSGNTEGLTTIDAGRGSITDTGTDTTPAAVTVALSVLGTPGTAEPWEGVLITIDETADVTVSDQQFDNFGEFRVSDGTDSLFVDDFLYDIFDNAATFPSFVPGATFQSVTGPLNYTFGDFKVAPRDATDLAGYVPGLVSGTSVEDLDPGDLIITEIMYNPAVCPDENCEYIEIFNASGQEVNLNGLIVDDVVGGGGQPATVSANVTLADGAYAILGQMPWGYQTVIPDIELEMPAFNQSNDSVTISNSTEVIDSTATYPTGGTEGYAWKLDVAPDATANDDAMNWCEAPSAFEGTDYGSPGAANNAGCAMN